VARFCVQFLEPTFEIMPQTKIQEKFYPLTSDVTAKLRQAKLTAAEWRIWCYLVTIKPLDNCSSTFNRDLHIDFSEVMNKCNCSKATFYRAIAKLHEIDALPQWFNVKEYDNIEQKICHLLKNKLGGLTEVSTPAGRIDLLTESEIIEVKRISDWKTALGQVLVYSGFYPEHRKRIHLFGNSKELERLADIEAACLTFDANVTAEEV
jgi:predicted DNA-binding transcriptional regulator AlpA